MIWGTRKDSSVLDIAMPLKKPLDNTEKAFECRYLVSQNMAGEVTVAVICMWV